MEGNNSIENKKNTLEVIKTVVPILSLLATIGIAIHSYSVNSKTAQFNCQNTIFKEDISKLTELNSLISEDLYDYYTSDPIDNQLFSKIISHDKSIRTHGKNLRNFCNINTENILIENEKNIKEFFKISDPKDIDKMDTLFTNLKISMTKIEDYNFKKNCCD